MTTKLLPYSSVIQRFIQRFLENLTIGIVLFTLMSFPFYTFIPYLITQPAANYKKYEIHSSFILQKNITYNNDQLCLSNWSPNIKNNIM